MGSSADIRSEQPECWDDLVSSVGNHLVTAIGAVEGMSGGLRALVRWDHGAELVHSIRMYAEIHGEGWFPIAEIKGDGEFVHDIWPWSAPDGSGGGIAIIWGGGAGSAWRLEIWRRTEDTHVAQVCDIAGNGGDENLPLFADLDGDGLREIVSLDVQTATGDHEYRLADVWKWDSEGKRYELWRRSARLRMFLVVDATPDRQDDES